MERKLVHARPVGSIVTEVAGGGGGVTLFQEQGKQVEDFKQRSDMIRCAEQGEA